LGRRPSLRSNLPANLKAPRSRSRWRTEQRQNSVTEAARCAAPPCSDCEVLQAALGRAVDRVPLERVLGAERAANSRCAARGLIPRGTLSRRAAPAGFATPAHPDLDRAAAGSPRDSSSGVRRSPGAASARRRNAARQHRQGDREHEPGEHRTSTRRLGREAEERPRRLTVTHPCGARRRGPVPCSPRDRPSGRVAPGQRADHGRPARRRGSGARAGSRRGLEEAALREPSRPPGGFLRSRAETSASARGEQISITAAKSIEACCRIGDLQIGEERPPAK
jgi:hypothetical protein